MTLTEHQQALLAQLRAEFETEALLPHRSEARNALALALIELGATRYSMYREICNDRGIMTRYVAWGHRAAVMEAIAEGAKGEAGTGYFHLTPLVTYIDEKQRDMKFYGVIPGYPPTTSLWRLVPESVRNWFGRK